MTAAPMSDIRRIEHLDFTPSCVCENGRMCGHGDQGHECGQPAALLLTYHNPHECDTDATDLFGNEVGPICRPCFDRLLAASWKYIRRCQQVATKVGGFAMCQTCGGPLMAISDIIRDARPIR